MTGEGRIRGDRLRRSAAVIVLGAAALITAATSYVDTEVAETLEGGSFLLSPDAPLASVPVTFEATGDSFEGDPHVLLDVTYTLAWSEVEEAHQSAPSVRLVPAEAASRSALGEAWCRAGDCRAGCTGRQCVGEHELEFRWPEQLEVGSVRVDWALEGRFIWPDDGGFFSQVPEVPDGTELRLGAGERVGGAVAPTPVVEWETQIDPEFAVARELVTVTTGGELDGGTLSLETRFDRRFEPGDLRVALPSGWSEADAPLHLGSASSVPIAVPESCDDGPCTFTFETLGQLVRPSTSTNSFPASIGWVVASTTPVDVGVAVEPLPISEVAGTADLGRIVLEGADATDGRRLVVTIPAEALPLEEWPPELGGHLEVGDTPNRPAVDGPAAGAGPVVVLELRPSDVATPSAAEGARVSLLVVPGGQRTALPGDGSAQWWRAAATSEEGWDSWRTPLPNRCWGGESCDIEVLVIAESHYRDPPEGAPVIAFDLEVEVAVLLPWTRPTPSQGPTIRVITDEP